MIRALLLFSLFTTSVQADSGTARHIAASALLTASLYVAMSALMGREQAIKGPSLGAAVGMALATGLAVEAMQAMQRGDRRIDRMDMMSNVAGVAGAAAAIMIIDF